MDKLKIFLAAVEKHQFWVCCGVMLLTSLGCWWCASEDEARRFVTRKTAIDGDFSGAVVQSGAPNKGVIDKIKQQDDELKLKVFDAWRALYTEQKKNDPFPTKLLGEEFKKEFQKLQLPKDQLDPIYLEIYENHIRDYLPALEEIVKVRHEVVKEGETAPRGGLGIPPMQPGVRPGFGGGRMGGIMPPPNARGNPMIRAAPVSARAPMQRRSTPASSIGTTATSARCRRTSTGEAVRHDARSSDGPGRSWGVRDAAEDHQKSQRRGHRSAQCGHQADRRSRHRQGLGQGLG